MIVERLKEARENKGLSQTDVAEKLNISRQAYNHYETGKREPTHESLGIIATLLSVSTDYLIGKTDDSTPPEAKQKAAPEEQPLSEEIRGLIGDVQDLTPEETAATQKFVDFLKSQRNPS